MEFLNHVLAVIPGGDWGAAGTVAVVVEFALRMFPSQKPLSIAYMVEDGCKLVGQVFGKLGDLLEKVLPQRLK